MANTDIAINSMAPDHLPGFLASADGSDPLFTVISIFAIGMILGVGTLYFTLHAIPERMAHSANSTQFQLIGILALLALFTHNNLFWVVALVLAAFRMPDFLTPLNSIAKSLENRRERGPDE
jgi:hypothetical protein